MSAIDEAHPRLAMPPRPERRMGLRQFLRVMRDNALSTFGPDAYTEEILERRFFWKRNTLINEPSGIKHVLLDNAANYHKTEIARRLLEPGLGRGLLTSEGETWRRHRRIMAPSFDHRSIMSYAPTMTAIAEELLAKWDGMPEGTEIDVAAAMMHATLHIISRTMFSSNSAEIVEVVERGVGRYQAEMRPGIADLLGLPRWISRLAGGTRGGHIFTEFDRAIDRLLALRERAGENQPKDLLWRLLAARDEETGGGMSAKEVRDQVVTIFMAGHETTAVALTWTWYLLAQHPGVEDRLHAELDAVLGDRSPRHEDLAKLPYARSVIDESMRLYPPAHTLSRTAIADDVLLGRPIPKGSQVVISPWLVHRNPKLWENPERFDPGRFSPENASRRHRFAYLPFGGGPRICIGAAFAIAEALLILATIAQRYRLRLVPGFPIEPQGLITLRPRHGMRMTLKRRVAAR
jgi:cytochrome P450